MVVMERGKIVRARVAEVRRTGRNTMGVQFATPDKRDSIVAVARNADRNIEVVLEAVLGDDSEPAAVGSAPVLAGSEPESAMDAGSVAFEPDPDDSVDGTDDDQSGQSLDGNLDDEDDDGGNK